MILDNLEARLKKNGTLEAFNKDTAEIDEDVRNLLKLLFGVASELDNAKQEYVIHGGYAVLVHLADCLGTKAIPKWRGSHDLDLVANERIVTMLKSYLNILSDRESQRVKGKRTLKVLLEESEKPYKLDLRMIEQFADDSAETYRGEVDTLTVYGISVRVPKLMRLLKDKLSVSRNLERDNVDILNLIGVLYLRKTPAERVIGGLDLKERKRLYSLIAADSAKEKFIKENVLIEVSDKYLLRFKKQLKKRIK
ncbi:hypothetical protein KY346_06470 [Candidatus Woesearchaeota archaeon]|nr:hypothetical protein [Candidatus Woesearchaeota archaeon]